MSNPASEDYDPNADEIIEESSRPSILQHPERRLLDAILRDAIKEIEKKSKHARDALKWLEEKDEDWYPWTFSFQRDVAPELKLDVEAARDALTGRKKPYGSKDKNKGKKKQGKGRPKH